MTILIHDGRRVGHLKWATNAIADGVADGIIISPFSTPRVTEPRRPSGRVLSEKIAELQGEVIFDAMTHARLLSSTNKLDCYDTWGLWDGTPSLSTTQEQIRHLERVFTVQTSLDAPLLAPTVLLQSAPYGQDASVAMGLGYMARGIDSSAWQSLAGNATFWASEEALDQHVGQLASLRAKTWVLTCSLSDTTSDREINQRAKIGFYRTVRSLSVRSRVIISHADFDGLPAIAAGGSTLCTGWDQSMRRFDANSFIRNDDNSVRIPASYVPQGNLLAVLRRDAAEAINAFDATLAETIRGGRMPLSDQEERTHHLKSLCQVVNELDSHSDTTDRISRLVEKYTQGISHYDFLSQSLGGQFFNSSLKSRHLTEPLAGLREFMTSEGITI